MDKKQFLLVSKKTVLSIKRVKEKAKRWSIPLINTVKNKYERTTTANKVSGTTKKYEKHKGIYGNYNQTSK